MARRVFFSFHYDNDIWRANQVRMANVVAGPDGAGFFDHSEYEEAKRTGAEGIKRMILRHLNNTTVTVVLIGRLTASRPWVQYEIAESIKSNNGLLGIYIYHLRSPLESLLRSPFGDPGTPPLPAVPPPVPFPTYMWDAKHLPGFAQVIEEAGRRSDALRKSPTPPPPFRPFPPPRFRS